VCFLPKYLNVTAFPSKKNLVPRFRNRMESDDQIQSWLEGSLESYAEDMTQFPKLLLLQCDGPTEF
jgi:hypothetical protein